MALSIAQPKLAANLQAHYDHLMTCPETIDTRDHLPLFRSLGGSILEIGCDCGNSTTAFLLGGAQVTSIDVNPLCAENFPDSSNWRFVLGDSRLAETYDKVSNQQFDVLYVDGSHTYEATLHDLHTYLKLVVGNGLVLLHDVLANDNFPGVWKAFNEFRWYITQGRITDKYIRPGSYGLGVVEL
jgi:hypothetical protein